ncbi:MAG: rhodanese-like domain-containing protein [Candidatus Faecousia sp.]|nr:rhodanese-like domain-containing protein [Candidatus Faecousia sp.]
MNITAEEAKKLMDSEEGCIILDVRTREEYDQGHIPGAILIPDTEIEAKAADLLPDKDQLILVYCRSGRRSKLAAQSLADLGYTNIREFGGILDWPYEVVQDN